jgi:hypothetical protein
VIGEVTLKFILPTLVPARRPATARFHSIRQA